jgi:hypothetical protein
MADLLRVAKKSDADRHEADHDPDESTTPQERPPLRAKIKRRSPDNPRPRRADPTSMTLPTGKIRYEIEGGKQPGTDHFEATPSAPTYEWEKQRPPVFGALLRARASRRRASPIF